VPGFGERLRNFPSLGPEPHGSRRQVRQRVLSNYVRELQGEIFRTDSIDDEKASEVALFSEI